ncbi:phage portal protein [Aggregatilinea lenta]|uniref:phage portal protein n=1 Tax=Aggregatilinea lenta TaxID=913108 RepID=UPI000E5B7E84|nr:phage portal protein [Aggregatilinea lenta]
MDHTFPWFSDLGGALPANAAAEWWGQMERYGVHHRYYSGLRLKETIEDPTETNPPELFPVRMNLVKLLCHSQADAIWGEWDDRLFHLDIDPGGYTIPTERAREAADNLRRYIYDVLDDNGFDTKGWELVLDRERYGGGVLKVSPDPRRPFGVRIERLPVTAFFPVWNPDDPDELIEAYLVILVPGAAAREIYGISTDKQFVYRIEHWTRSLYTNTVEGKRIDQYSGRNPWGKIPLIYFPRLRADSPYGDALTDAVSAAQDEMNIRLADIGEAITYNAHPLKWGVNLPNNINDRDEFPLDPDQLWNLGRTLPGNEPPQINLLEAKNPVPESSFDHVNFVYDWARTASYAPPVAFGIDQGSQRSGATLIIRMWPLTRSIKRSRTYLRSGILRLVDLIVTIAQTNRPARMPAGLLSIYDTARIQVNFAPILPRERTEIVDEVVKRLSTTPKTLSLESGLELLGAKDPAQEIERIRADEDRAAEMAARIAEQTQPDPTTLTDKADKTAGESDSDDDNSEDKE